MTDPTASHPLPWSYTKNHVGSLAGGEGYVVRDAGGNLVAVAESEDVARFIVAAPDLAAIVAELIDSATYWSEYDVPMDIVDRMRAALAKAQGGVA